MYIGQHTALNDGNAIFYLFSSSSFLMASYKCPNTVRLFLLSRFLSVWRYRPIPKVQPPRSTSSRQPGRPALVAISQIAHVESDRPETVARCVVRFASLGFGCYTASPRNCRMLCKLLVNERAVYCSGDDSPDISYFLFSFRKTKGFRQNGRTVWDFSR